MDAVYIIGTIIFGIEFIMGVLGNGFIAVVKGMDWVRRRKLSPVDRILTALAVSRIGLIWLVFIYVSAYAVHPDMASLWKLMRFLSIPLTAASHFSIWLATSLSILYFLKIATFSNSVFLYLRRRVTQVVPAMLLLSLIPLCLNILLTRVYIDIWVDEFKENMSTIGSLSNSQRFGKLVLGVNTVFVIIPFAVSLTAFLLLILSLCRHLRTMRGGAPGCRDASTAAHVRALRRMVAFLLLYAVFFLSFLVRVWNFMFLDKYLIVKFFCFTELVFPSVHSCVLIVGDGKLRQVAVSVLRWLRGRCMDVGRP